jgi:hypothetical protein
MAGRAVTALLAIVVGVCVFVAAPSARTGAARPVVHIRRTVPFTVSGANFAARERVLVVVRADGRFAKTVVANGSGGFIVAFRSVTLDACGGYLIVASGDRGSRARLRVTPECTPLQP